jgi:hypothetical protein
MVTPYLLHEIMSRRQWKVEESVAASALDDAVSTGCRSSLAQEPPPMTQRYHAASRPDSFSSLAPNRLAQVLAQDGQLLLPVLDLIENAQATADDLIDVMGRATIGAALMTSATQLAGLKQRGKKTDRDVAFHGSQAGRVALKERQLRVTKSRLRR